MIRIIIIITNTQDKSHIDKSKIKLFMSVRVEFKVELYSLKGAFQV